MTRTARWLMVAVMAWGTVQAGMIPHVISGMGSGMGDMSGQMGGTTQTMGDDLSAGMEGASGGIGSITDGVGRLSGGMGGTIQDMGAMSEDTDTFRQSMQGGNMTYALMESMLLGGGGTMLGISKHSGGMLIGLGFDTVGFSKDSGGMLIGMGFVTVDQSEGMAQMVEGSLRAQSEAISEQTGMEPPASPDLSMPSSGIDSDALFDADTGFYTNPSIEDTPTPTMESTVLSDQSQSMSM